MADSKASDEEARQYAESIINAVREPLILLDSDLKVISASRSFYEIFETDPKETVGRLIYDLGTKQWDIPELRELLETLLPRRTTIEDYAVEREFAGPGRRTMLLNAREIQIKPGKQRLILLAMEDITGRKHAEDALRRSENYYRAIFETSGAAMFIIEEDTTISHVNSHFETLSGYTGQEVEGKKSWTEFVHADDVEWMKKTHHLRRHDPRAAPLAYEFRFFVRNGELRHGYLTADIIPGTSQSVVSLIDITERKQTEEAIEKERTYLSAVIDNIGDAIVICDAQGRITRFNETARRLHGLPEQPIPPDQWARHYDLYQEDGITPLPMEDIPLFRALRGQRVLNSEIVVAPKNGRPYFLVCNGQALTDETGKIIGAVVAMHDITERKRMEQALRRGRDLNQRYLDTTQTMMVALDAEGRVTMINRSGRELLGYAEDEILGCNWFETCLPHPEGLDSVYPVFLRIMAGDRTSFDYFENSVVCRDGTLRLMGWHNAFLEDDDGRVVGTLSSGEDITERKQAEQALRESEARYRTLFERTANPIMVIDDKGNYINANESALQFFECSRDELLGKNVVDFNPPGKDQVMEDHLPAWETGGVLETEYLIKGKVKTLILTITPGMWSGQPVVFGDGKDITERKWAEEARRKSEERYRTILNEMSEGYHEVDLAGNFTFFNEAFLNLFGYSRDEMMGSNFKHYAAEEAMAKTVYRLYNEMYKTGVPIQNCEWDIIRKDGERRTLEFYASVVRDSADIPTGFRGIVRDITERKRAEHKLRESEQKYRFMTEQMNDVVWTTDLEMRITYISPSDERILGFTPEERMEHTLADMLTPLSQEHAMAVISKEHAIEETRDADSRRIVSIELEYRHKDGSTRLLETLATGIRDDEGRLIGLHGVSRDITDRKQAEKEREKLQSQLYQAQKMESVGRLAGGVAHDFNNKLSVINGYAEMAMDMIDPASPLHETIREIHTAGKNSADIVRQLLAFARKQTISPVRLDLNDTISSMLKMLQRLIGENINLEWRPGNNLWPVKIDPSQIDQIMANLAVNSRDAISDVGKLTIETENIVIDEDYCRANPEAIPGQYVMLAVSDNGCGMKKEVRDFLFEPFFTTKEIGKGTGLGLPTIYGIVKQNKGFINVYSEPGEGTTFKLYLPSREEATSSLQFAKESTGHIPTGAETILVVEDEKTILQMSKKMLERLGYTVETAGSPAEALQFCKQYDARIHLLITDVIMPEMNGRDLSSQLIHQVHPGLKTLYMSGYTANVIAHHGVLDEGVQFIQKPFSLRDLAVKVREALEQE